MKKVFKLLCLVVSLFAFNVYADTYVNLDNFKVSTDKNDYSDIKEYDSLEDFLEDYNSNNLPNIYLTTFLFDGVSSVKTPDLDDFIDNNSNDTKIKTLEINVININTTGNIELSGSTTGTMIAVNTNNVTEDINLILNGVNIDTDSKKVPAIYIYNKDTTYTGCKVTIKTLSGTKNYINGGKLKKVSLLDKDNLDSYSSNYNGDALTNYTNFSNYYGIYTKDEISKILFATVTADNEDLQDGDPLYFYKGSGAISSDIDLYFEGQGYLEVTSKNKEGIETKGNLTFSGGSGDYVIYAYDDALNTTTASSMGSNVHNTMIIDVNSLVAIVNDDGDEGDGIDSNGTLTINGGTIYAFSHSTSNDAGLDSNGTYINGGTIIATGNMTDEIENTSSQKYIYLTFNNTISKDTLIVVKDEEDNIIFAFKTDKDIKNILYSSSDLEYENLKVYTGGTIDGDNNNGLYTNITSYTGGTETSYSLVESRNSNFNNINQNNNNFIPILLGIESSILVIFLLIVYLSYKNRKHSL